MDSIFQRFLPKRPPRGEREPGVATMAIAQVPFTHERERDAFEAWSLRPVIHSLHPVVHHITDEGDPYWEIWFVHNNRPVILSLPSPGVGELTMDDLAEYLAAAIVHEREGSASADELHAARFVRRAREMITGETWSEPEAPPTNTHDVL